MTGYWEYYTLNGNVALPCTEMQCREARFEDRRKRSAGDINPSRVGLTKVGDTTVSTVFLWLNHAYDEGPPMIFETLVFGGPLEGEMERCSTWEEAEAIHAAMVERVKVAQP
jgi:hypothetical protein